MEEYFKNVEKVVTFQKPKTIPTSLDPDTTALSPFFKYGSLSIRIFYWELTDLYQKYKNHSQPPESLLGQIYFREYFYLCSYKTINFDKMKGNGQCRQIDWEYDYSAVEKWENGMTGYPAIDAVMRQLVKEGWIHHLARHLVACFLTRGDLF